MRLLAIFAAFVMSAAVAKASDDHVGYYHPEITSEETFTRVIAAAPPANAAIRSGFVTSITKAQLAAPESPRFVLTEKGDASDKLIIVGLDDDVFSTLYRARAVLSQLSSNFRGTDFFIQQDLQVEGTFFDMLQIMQFRSLVITDGETWAHRVNFEPAN
ncbi:MAG: hypothetical protein AAFU55_02065 [Pseudomonadota bacterium]